MDVNLFNYTNTISKKYQFLINKKFQTCAEINDRTIEVAEAFGLGIDDEFEFTIFDNFSIGFNEGDVVYITGDSGSGKSILLKEIMNKIPQGSYIHEKFLNIDENETLINGIGKDLNEALKILGIVGLNDAFLFLRKYNQLSDGQKLRYKLAKMINSNKDIFIFDEFTGQLDRETAKIISFNIQKYIRKNKKILIIATTQTDLKDDLLPNVYVYKKFNNDYLVEYNNKTPLKCSIVEKLEIKELSSLNEIKDLEKFHYRGEASQFRRIFGLYLNNNMVGAMVIANPMVNLKGRNIYLENKFAKTTSANMVMMNKEVEVISRVIIHPKYRGIGLAYYFIENYIKNYSTARYIETIAVMAGINPFFEKAGLTLIDTSEKKDENYEKNINGLKDLGFDINFLKSWKYIKNKYNEFDDIKKQEFKKIYEKLYQGYKATHGSGCIPFEELQSNGDDFFKYFKKCIRGDIKYLIYDNSEKYNKLNDKNKLF